MEKENLVEIERIEQTGNRQKAVYRITDDGRAHLTQLIADSLGHPSVHYPSGLYSGLSFIEKLPVEVALKALKCQLNNLTAEQEALEKRSQTQRNRHASEYSTDDHPDF